MFRCGPSFSVRVELGSFRVRNCLEIFLGFYFARVSVLLDKLCELAARRYARHWSKRLGPTSYAQNRLLVQRFLAS